MKSKEGGCLLFETNQKQVAQPEQPDGPAGPIPVPEQPELEAPALLIGRGAKEPDRKTATHANVVTGTRPDLPAEITRSDEKVINWRSPTTLSNVTGRINRLALRSNAALLGLDIANELYEHWDEINSVKDVARVLVPYAKDAAHKAAEIALDIASGVHVGVPEMSAIIGLPAFARTADNLADLLGMDTDVQGDLARAEVDAEKFVTENTPDFLVNRSGQANTVTTEVLKHGPGPVGVLSGIGKALGWLK